VLFDIDLRGFIRYLALANPFGHLVPL
jgi:hypothetical protein